MYTSNCTDLSPHHDNHKHHDQHTESWRSDLVSSWRRGHTGGSQQDTHDTPVLPKGRRPWVSLPRAHQLAAKAADAVRCLNSFARVQVCCVLFVFCANAKCVYVALCFSRVSAECVVRCVFERVQSVCCALCFLRECKVFRTPECKVRCAWWLFCTNAMFVVRVFFARLHKGAFLFSARGEQASFFFLRVRFSPVVQHWSMRTSFEPQSVSTRLKSSEWLVARGFVYRRRLVSLPIVLWRRTFT